MLDIDTWVGSSGKNGMRRDWLIRGRNSGDTFVRATRQANPPPEPASRLCKITEVRIGVTRLICSFLQYVGDDEQGDEEAVKDAGGGPG